MDVSKIDFNDLVNAHYEALYRFALSLAKGEAQAADLTQQTFYLWATKGHQLRDLTKAKSWLFTTLYREFLGGVRRSTRFPHVDVDTAEIELPSTQPRIAKALDGASAVEALQSVDEIYRAPLTLFYLEEFAYREIAELLDVPIGTVMSRLSRGKAQLRKIFEEKGDSGDDSGKIVPMDQKPLTGTAGNE